MSTPATPLRQLRFGAFELDVRAGELRKNGTKVRLQGQPLQVLEVLLRGAGDLVTREDLRTQIWPEDTFVDFDHGLNNAIARLRAVLGDSSDAPRFIETLPRRGYRFIAPVIFVNGAEPQAGSAVAEQPAVDVSVTPQPARSFGLRRTSAVVVLALLVLAVAGLTFWRLHASAPPTSAAARMTSIAVLPFANLSHDPEQEYFSDGMTSAIIAAISDIRPLRVISRTSTGRYKGTKKSLPEIAKELNVDAVIEGSVQRAGNRVRIDVELIDGASDKQLWSESYERELGDLLKLDSEIAQGIATRVKLQISDEQVAKFRNAPSVNQVAYDDYLRGRRYLDLGLYPQLRIAQQYYEKSVREDPSFVLGYLGLAETYESLGMVRRLSPQEVRIRSWESIRKALQLDPSVREVNCALGNLHWRFEWNWPQAEEDYRRAIDLNPSSMDGHGDYAWFLSWSGRRSDATAEIGLMRKLDPAFPRRWLDESGLHYHLREYEDLMRSGQEGVAVDPDNWAAHYFLGVGEYGTGKKVEAIAEFERAFQLSEDDQDVRAALAFAYASTGRRSEAFKILRSFQSEKATGSYVSPYMLGVISAGLGDQDKAFEYLEAAYSEKSSDLVYFIKADYRLDGLRSDPRFANLLARVVPAGITR